MVGIVLPRDGPRTDVSRGERRVYEALERSLPAGWTAWHSLRLRVGAEYEGEGDFILAAPERGMLVLEVKDGRVELQAGRWSQNGAPMKKPPLDQARSLAGHLADEIRDRSGTVPPFGVACVFPDVDFSDEHAPTEGGVHGRVLGARDLEWLGDALQSLAERAIPARRVPAAKEWVPKLTEIWGETWVPRVRLADAAEDAARRAVALDREQLALLDYAGENTRALVDGGAGSGKTTVALELCLRRARHGERVLYVCFTDALARAVDRSMEEARSSGARARAVPIRRYARQLLQDSGVPLDPESPDFWANVSLQAACDAALAPEDRADLVVVDEAQDFAENDWGLVGALSDGRGLWAFQDPRQRFWSDRSVAQALLGSAPRLMLRRQHRNPPAIEWFASQYRPPGATSEPPPRPPPDELDALRVVVARDVLDRVRHELDALRREGVRPGDIAVLSLGGQTKSALLGLDKLGSHRLVRADADDATRQIVADTFLRFKGLDRPFVIVTEVELGTGNAYATRMYVALTRATVRATIVCGAEATRTDIRLQHCSAEGRE